MSTLMERTFNRFKGVKQKQNEILGPQDDESDVFLLSPVKREVPYSIRKIPSQACRTPVWPWILLSFLLAMTSTWLALSKVQDRHRSDSYEFGFRTDLKVAASKIKLKRVRFNSALSYDSNGTLIREHGPDELNWVGEPTAQMDALWDQLEAASGVYLEGGEAETTRGKTRLYNGYWVTGLDVFHQIHCLNMVRKALYPDTYHMDGEAEWVNKIHVEHCLDYVRQAILCSSDMTPVNVVWFDSSKRYAPDFNTYHTCRDVDLLADWSMQRSTRAHKGSETGESAKARFHKDG